MSFCVSHVINHPSVFGSGFAEASADDGVLQSQVDADDLDAVSDYMYPSRQYDDSDDEDDDLPTDILDEPSLDGVIETEDTCSSSSPTRVAPSTVEPVADPEDTGHASLQGVVPGEDHSVKQKISHPSTPRSPDAALKVEKPFVILSEKAIVPGPKKMRVVIRDVAYATYKAVLYYVSLLHNSVSITEGSYPVYPDIYRRHRLRTTLIFFYGLSVATTETHSLCTYARTNGKSI